MPFNNRKLNSVQLYYGKEINLCEIGAT